MVNVASVSFLNGEKNRWSGEPLRLSKAHVSDAAVRKLDKKRSWITAGIVAVAVTAFVASRGLSVFFGGEAGEEPTPPPPPTSLQPRLLLPNH